MYNYLIIRKDKVKELVLTRNREKVYFLFRYGQSIFNSLVYDTVSDRFDEIVNA